METKLRKRLRYTTKMKDVALNLGVKPRSLPDEIKRYINDEGLSQTEVAEILGVKKATLAYWIHFFKLEMISVCVGPTEEAIVVDKATGDPGSNVITP